MASVGKPRRVAHTPNEIVTKYSLGILAAIFALLLRRLLSPVLGGQNPYHTLWLAVVFSSWYCGIGPSIITVVVGGLGIWYWFLPPMGWRIQAAQEAYGMLGFVLFSAVIIALGESTRRVIEKRRAAERALTQVQQELEDRVRERTSALERTTAEVVEKAALLDLANDAIFVKTATGEISYWNQGAERLYGWKMSEALGHAPADLLKSEYPVPLAEIESKNEWEGEIHHTTRSGNRIIVASRWTTLRDENGVALGWLEINTDITARKRAEEAARSLGGHILTLQDEEHRRIARGLHDSLGQYLTALKINLDVLAATDGNSATLSECANIADRCLTETRTISHLLHPPMLDEAGLGSAVRWYVDGFAQRSGIHVNLDLPLELRRMDRDVEVALFRAVQEALTNIHRHSGASVVDVALTVHDQKIRLRITDNGTGIPHDRLRSLIDGTAGGIGIAGMRERMRDLSGSLDLQSSPAGTTLVFSIPIERVQAEAK
jgi:PAS domain S-box-containing protein